VPALVCCVAIYLYHVHKHLDTGAQWPEELPEKRRLSEIAASSIGSAGAHRQARFQY
jgi:hypothetical protein